MSGFVPFQQGESFGIEFAGGMFLQGVEEFAILGRGLGEESHRGTKFQIIGRAEDFVQRSGVDEIHESRALSQPRTENRVLQVCVGFFERRNCEPLCGRATTQTFDLRKDVPHPVSSLASGAQFDARVFVVFLLRFQEALEIVGIEWGDHEYACRCEYWHSTSRDNCSPCPVVASRISRSSMRLKLTSEDTKVH